ncbi:Gfo/Idh/MocA family protein [Alkalihalobacillus trypoxylicola]|uniref:Dehydrogenase n=1 Tax=Alkalihalobacillus trypoxylicola TaxID=519424 RepID=A0A161PGL2_9BACI|nr:Gfo/Idh/MocA family oxidoreductase [Alkalihalobacillus trypoxylicola]KYG32377.1 dehydrogenase [Alkalihalobacillus trypoxylicola]
MSNQINIGMIGYKFMGKAHSLAYRNMPFYFKTGKTPVLKTLCGRNEQEVKQAATNWGFQQTETDWKKVIEDPEIDLIDIVTPNHLHAEMAIAALEAGKHVICEKPLALNLEQAIKMEEVARKSGKIAMICHNYRFAPAVQYAKKLIDEGKLGKIRQVRATYLQDWLMDPEFPLTWRLDKEVTGTGALGDIGAHSIDLARFLIGEITDVVSLLETFIKERPTGDMVQGLSAKKNQNTEMGQVTVDDAALFLAKFENGAIGTFESSRFAGGNKNGNRFEINGEKGSIKWDLENMNLLEVYFEGDEEGLKGFRTINCTEEIHPYASAYWPSGHIIGYEHTFINLVKDLFDGIDNQTQPKPDFIDGLRNQEVLHAVEQSSLENSWKSIDTVR